MIPKLGVLVSGKGSNLQSIIQHIETGKLQAEISVVISDKYDVGAIDIAEEAEIPTIVVDRRQFRASVEFDREILEILQQAKAQWVVLAGFMRILGSEFLAKYPHKIMNIHPSLLPQYPGLNAIQKALDNKEKVTGVTVHYVDEGVDTGRVIAQEKVAISPDDNLQTLEKKIHLVEHQIYPKAIQKVLWGK